MPFVVRADGQVEQLGEPGTLLGTFADPELHDVAIDLWPGDAIVAYTDGLVERRDLGIDVRGDILTVVVLALAGIPRRLGWAMGGGGFLLTDTAAFVWGRHEVRSRQALLETGSADERLVMLRHAMNEEMRAMRAIPSLPATEVSRTGWSPN